MKKVLKTIRHSIPYCAEKQLTGKKCFYTHIGLCNPCPSYISGLPEGEEKSTLSTIYRQNIRRIDRIFEGKMTEVIGQYKLEMNAAAASEHYEYAAECRNIIRNLTTFLTHGYDPEVYLQHDIDAASLAIQQLKQFSDQIRSFYPHLTAIERIECYDISHTAGKETTGSMVVLHNGLPETGSYRRFKVHLEHTPDDPASIAEILTRRLNHPEWPIPDLFLIDGGKTQVAAAKAVIDASPYRERAVIGLAKRFEELIIPVEKGFEVLRLSEHHEALKFLERIRDEAHRFAITYHRKLRAQAFLPQTTKLSTIRKKRLSVVS